MKNPVEICGILRGACNPCSPRQVDWSCSYI